MLNNRQIEALQPRHQPFFIICLAMPIGAIAMTLALFVIKDPPKFTKVLDVMTIVGLFMALPSYLASFIAPRIMQSTAITEIASNAKSRKELEGSHVALNLFGALQNSQVIRVALIEGAVFANILMWYVSGSVYNVITAAVGIMLLLLAIPGESSTLSKIEDMLESVRDLANFPNEAPRS